MGALEIINKVWNYARVLRDDGVGYGDYFEQWSILPADVKGEIYEGLLERNAQHVKAVLGNTLRRTR